MARTILVTGCAGFIGGNFVREYSKQFPKDCVVGIDDLSAGRREVVPASVVFYEASITDMSTLKQIFAKHKPEYVFHFAALPRVSYSVEAPHHTSEINVLGTIALLELSHKYKVKRFIFSSSAAVYGNARKLPTHESAAPGDMQSPYATQKYTGELFCKQFATLYKLDTVCLRYFNVFGPGQYGDSAYSTVVSAWLEALYFPKKKKPFIEGTGNNTRDFVYVGDVVRANILAMQNPKPCNGEAFNIGSANKTRIKDVATFITKHSGRVLALDARPPRIGDVKHALADIGKARKVLKYTPQTSFEEGLKKTIEWFENR